jgi:hypothetical protein
MSNRANLLILLTAPVIAMLLLFWYLIDHRQQRQPSRLSVPIETQASAGSSARRLDVSTTHIHAHNLLLRKGPNFRVYVRWLDGRLTRTRPNVNPSFDHPESFNFDIQSGIIRANIGDIGHYLNTSLAESPLRNVTLLADGPNLKLTGTLRKILPLPVQVIASVSANSDERVRVHIIKINVLKMPVKGLLGLFRVSAADLVKSNIEGMEIEGNDLLLTTQKLLPAPHIRGHLTRVSVDSPDIQAVFSNAENDMERIEPWRNFFSLRGGTLDFGSLSMHPVNIIMIDISSNPWFDLDLVNYRDQFASGYTRMTDDAGLQMFIPDRRDIKSTPGRPSESIQWFKDRSIPPPPQITASVRH